MTLRPVDKRDPWIDKIEPPRGRLVVLWSLAAVTALAAQGCVTAPRQPDAQAAHDDLKSAASDQADTAKSRTDFHEKATERQQFQVHIDFGRAFETQGNLDAAIQEYQDALKVVENKRRGRSGAGRRGGARVSANGECLRSHSASSPRPKHTIRRHSISARKTPRSGTTRGIAIISRGGGPMPSERSTRPPNWRLKTSESAPTWA